MMDSSHLGGWDMGLGSIAMVLFWGLIIYGLFYAFKSAAADLSAKKRAQSSAIEILEKRFAKGEIDKDEYESIKRNLGGS